MKVSTSDLCHCQLSWRWPWQVDGRVTSSRASLFLLRPWSWPCKCDKLKMVVSPTLWQQSEEVGALRGPLNVQHWYDWIPPSDLNYESAQASESWQPARVPSLQHWRWCPETFAYNKDTPHRKNPEDHPWDTRDLKWDSYNLAVPNKIAQR